MRLPRQLLRSAVMALCGGLLLIAGSPAPSKAQEISVQELNCQGNEPFWSLRVSRQGAVFSALGEEARRYRGSLSRLDFLDPPWGVWRGSELPPEPESEAEGEAESARPGELVAVFRAELCLDTMSEEGGPFDRRGVVTLPDGRLLTGCCRSAVGLDSAQAPLADFEHLPRGDWTQSLPGLAEAVSGCLAGGFMEPVGSILGVWPLPNEQGLVRSLTEAGGREDCIAQKEGGAVVLSDLVAPGAAKAKTEGAPSFYPESLGPPLVTCGRLERVALSDPALSGWLHYEGPDCQF